ncbi:MAG TPA: hypothetical protein VIK02_02515 [Candidatus Anoxymicrobiaceae bacterium]
MTLQKFRLLGVLAIALLIAFVLPGCGGPQPHTIEQVKDLNTARLMSIEGVTGVGIGESDGHKVITVFLDNGSEAPRDKIPKTLEGYDVVIRVTGPIRPQ